MMKCSNLYSYIGNRYNNVFPLNELLYNLQMSSTCSLSEEKATELSAKVSSLGRGKRNSKHNKNRKKSKRRANKRSSQQPSRRPNRRK
jgi:hypothetical protein